MTAAATPFTTTRHRPVRVVVAAIALTAVAGVLALVLSHQALLRAVDDLEAEVVELQDQADVAGEADGALNARVGAIEAGLAGDFDPAALSAAVSPSVFTILAAGEGDLVSQGTGFVLAKDGRRSLVVTNFHVVADRWNLGADDVLLTQGAREYDGEIVRVEPAADLALIEVLADLPALTPASELPAIGDPVMVVGSGASLEGTITTGVVSSLDRELDGQTYLQFSAVVNPGNSGGPVLDAAGNVIGVTTLKLVGLELEGLSFAIPVARTCDLLDIC